jgi:hypothetical protein
MRAGPADANLEDMTLLDTSETPLRRLDRTGSALLIVGGIAFFVYGPLHPAGDSHGDKTEQLHSMLVDAMWYPAHVVGLLAFAAVAAGLLKIGRSTSLPGPVARATRIVGLISVAMTLGQVVHMFAASQASGIADGGTTPLVALFMGVETLVNPVWALAIAALAVIGGLSRTVGNRIVMPLGLIGGLAFALANATIAFTDTFDALFPVAGLIGIWVIAVGVIGLVRRS